MHRQSEMKTRGHGYVPTTPENTRIDEGLRKRRSQAEEKSLGHQYVSTIVNELPEIELGTMIGLLFLACGIILHHLGMLEDLRMRNVHH